MNNSRHGTNPPERRVPRMVSAPGAGRNGRGNGAKKDRETDTLERITNYRNRAAELRAISETLKTDAGREAVLQIALEYEQMAAALERRAPH